MSRSKSLAGSLWVQISGGVVSRVPELGTELHGLAPFTPKERAPGKYWIGTIVGPIVGLGSFESEESSYPWWESNHSSPVFQMLA